MCEGTCKCKSKGESYADKQVITDLNIVIGDIEILREEFWNFSQLQLLNRIEAIKRKVEEIENDLAHC